MRRIREVFLLAGLAIVAAPLPARAAFEDLEVSPRWRAVGGAGVAAVDDPYAALRNPSALAWADGVNGAFSYLQPYSLDFAAQNAVGGTFRLPGSAGGIGIGVRQFGVRYLGVSLDEELTITVSHGFRLMHDAQSELAFGWGVSLHHLSFGPSVTGLDPGSASTVGLDVGATAVIRDLTRVGFAIHDFNSPSIGDRDREPLPRRVTGGMVYQPYPGVSALVDLAAGLGEAIEYRGGIELEPIDHLMLRAGIGTEPNTFSAGIGFRIRGLALDYGFSSGGGVLDETHHVGLEIRGPGFRSGTP